ncbi:MAG: ArnT family glycosyltransferase [Nitrospinales bacterium]
MTSPTITVPGKTSKTPFSAACLLIGFFCLYLFTSPAKLPGGDEAILLGVADRVAHYGFSWLPPGMNFTKTFSSYGFYPDGFSKYGLGQSLIDMAVVRAFRSARKARDAQAYIFSVLTVYALAAFTGALVNVLFFLTCLKLGLRPGAGFFLTLVLGLTTMVWPYSQTLFSDPTLGLTWLLALFAFLSYKTSGRRFWLAVAGGAIGFAVLTKIVAAYAVPIFAAYFIYLAAGEYRSLKGSGAKSPLTGPCRSAFWFLAPLLAMGYTVLWYNHLRYGSYFALGYLDGRTYDVRDTMFGFNVAFPVGLYGQLLSSGKGFFFYNPSTVLAFFGWRDFYRRNSAEGLVLLSMIVGMIVIYSTWYGWHGDWSWGPRYLSCLPPFFLLLAGPFVERIIDHWRARQPGHRRAPVLVSLLLAVSLAVQIPGLCIKSEHYIQTVAAVGVFPGKFFDADWPIRDDSLQLHFIPEFSPLAGHLWMMRVIFHRGDEQGMKIFQSPPWKTLNTLWIPKVINTAHFQYNVWWLNARAAGLPGAGKTAAVAFLLGLLSLGALGTGLRAAWKSARPPTGHAGMEYND